MFSSIKNYLLMFLGGIVGLLIILLKFKSSKIKAQEQELEDKEIQIKVQDEYGKATIFEEVEKEAYKNVEQAEQLTEQARKERDDKSNDESFTTVTI